MNIEDLTKSQIILLTLFVSFVTSIATGIVTVSLLEQAPPAVTQTVNRVIQNTIEKVVPQTGKTIQTVVIKEEDLIGESLAENAKSLITIKSINGDQQGAPIGYGFLVSKDGLVVAPTTGITENTDYFITSNNVAYKAHTLVRDDRGFSLLKVLPTKDEQGDFKSFGFSVLGDSSALSIGQTVVSPSSPDGESINVAKGAITKLGGKDTALTDGAIEIAWSFGKPKEGSPLLDTDGAVIGVVVNTDGATKIISANTLKDAIEKL